MQNRLHLLARRIAVPHPRGGTDRRDRAAAAAHAAIVEPARPRREALRPDRRGAGRIGAPAILGLCVAAGVVQDCNRPLVWPAARAAGTGVPGRCRPHPHTAAAAVARAGHPRSARRPRGVIQAASGGSTGRAPKRRSASICASAAARLQARLDRQPNGCILSPWTVFKALADATRRKLLDRLHAENGQTLDELCARLA